MNDVGTNIVQDRCFMPQRPLGPTGGVAALSNRSRLLVRLFTYIALKLSSKRLQRADAGQF